MIVNQIHTYGLTVLETEDDPPVAGNTHAPFAGAVTTQPMQVRTWQVHVQGRLSSRELRQAILDTLQHLGRKTIRVVLFCQPFQSLMPELHKAYYALRIEMRQVCHKSESA